jgi:hypothetical protein
MKKRICLSAAILFVFQQFGLAQTSLEWNFKEVLYLEVKHVGKEEMSLFGETTTSESNIRFLFKVSPTKVDKAGAILDITILACEDTLTKKEENARKLMFKEFKDQQFLLFVKQNNKEIELSNVNGLNAVFLKALFGDKAKNATDDDKRIAASLAEAMFRTHLIDAFVCLPGNAVAVGDKWRNKRVDLSDPLSHLTIDQEYVLSGRQIHDGKKVEVISWASRIELKPVNNAKGIRSVKLKDVKPIGNPQNEGTVLWDNSVRRPIRVDCVQSYEFEMVFESEGETVKSRRKGSDSFVIQFFTKNPDVK